MGDRIHAIEQIAQDHRGRTLAIVPGVAVNGTARPLILTEGEELTASSERDANHRGDDDAQTSLLLSWTLFIRLRLANVLCRWSDGCSNPTVPPSLEPGRPGGTVGPAR